MVRYRTLTILLCGLVLLIWEFVGAAPPVAKDAKSKKSATADDDKPAKSNGKTSSAGKKAVADDATAEKDTTSEKVVMTDAEWRRILTPLQFKVTRKKFTEQAGSNPMAHFKKDGVYHCICCGEPLFDSKTKFDSGTGWPSFFQPIDEKHITELEDASEGAVRTEVQCSHCDAHLGHVFSDGPVPTGLRYCMNGASLKFVDRKKEQASKESKSPKSTAKTEKDKTGKDAKDGGKNKDSKDIE